MSGPWLAAPARPLAPDHTTDSSLVARLGAALRRRAAERLPSLHHVSDRELGAALIVGPVLGVAALPLVMAPILAVATLAVARARRQRRQLEHELTAGLADLLDQLALAVGAGLTLPTALRAIEPWVPAAYRTIVADTNRRLDDGASLAEAIGRLGAVVPDAGRRSVAVLAAAVRDGTPVGHSLARAAEEARRARRRAVETRVRRLPVLLLLPLVTCVLPAFVLLTLVPLVLGSLDGLQLPGS